MNVCSNNCFCVRYITVHFVADCFKFSPIPLDVGWVLWTNYSQCHHVSIMHPNTHVRKDIRNLFFQSHYLLFGRDYPLHTQSYSDYLISRVRVGLASVTDARCARSVVNHSGKSIKEGVNKPGSEKRGWSDPIMSKNKREFVSDVEHILHNWSYSSH